MAGTPTYYDLLGVSPKADPAEIKRAYYAKMRQHHPDNLMAERARLQIVGDQKALHALYNRMEEAKKITQRLNIAYTVLSDPDQRRAYDQQRRDEQERARRMAQDDPRIVVKHRPHRRPAAPPPPAASAPPPAPKPDKFPTLWIAGAIGMFFLTSIFMSNFFGYGLRNTYVPSPSLTPKGYVPTGSADATSTSVARSTQEAIDYMTAHPPTREIYLLAGDRLFEDGFYLHAAESYSHALEMQATADIYVKRGRAYAALNKEPDARRDFEVAMALDAAFAPAYAERGLLLAARWQATQDTRDAAQARADLEQAQALGDTSAQVQDALDALP